MQAVTLTGKVGFVTGGSRGIGLAIAQAMLDAGMAVAITGRSDAALAAARESTQPPNRERLATFAADVRRFQEVESALRATVKRFGGLDVLVNNAGIGIFRDVADMTPDEWSEIIDTNLT